MDVSIENNLGQIIKNYHKNIGVFIINEKQLHFNNRIEEMYLESLEPNEIPNGALDLDEKSN